MCFGAVCLATFSYFQYKIEVFGSPELRVVYGMIAKELIQKIKIQLKQYYKNTNYLFDPQNVEAFCVGF